MSASAGAKLLLELLSTEYGRSKAEYLTVGKKAHKIIARICGGEEALEKMLEDYRRFRDRSSKD